MNREEVLQIVREARNRDEVPDLHGADLTEVDLYGADLAGANLHGADLSGIDLSWADLRWADLRWAYLTRANLTRADLRGVNLAGANLIRANLAGAAWDGFYVDGIHPYRCLLVPTPDGWTVIIGCWTGTVAGLRALISRDDDWPEATGDQIADGRPRLAAFCDLCDAHIATHPGVIDDLAARWSA